MEPSNDILIFLEAFRFSHNKSNYNNETMLSGFLIELLPQPCTALTVKQKKNVEVIPTVSVLSLFLNDGKIKFAVICKKTFQIKFKDINGSKFLDDQVCLCFNISSYFDCFYFNSVNTFNVLASLQCLGCKATCSIPDCHLKIELYFQTMSGKTSDGRSLLHLHIFF